MAYYGSTVAPSAPAPAPRHEVVSERREPSFALMGFIVLLNDSPRGLMFPTLWPLVASYGGTRSSQGVIVAGFSFGRVLVSPIYGWISTRYGYRGVLTLAHVIIAVSALLYTQVSGLRTLLASQILMGIGCGTLGVTRAYVAESISREHRTVYLGRLTAAQYAGFTVTPFLGSILSKVAEALNKNGAPAWLHIDKNTFAANAFVNPPVNHTYLAVKLTNDNNGGTTDNEDPKPAVDPRDEGTYFVIVGLLLNVITKGSIGCYETLGVIYAQSDVGLSGPVVGYVVSACGAAGVLALLSFRPLSRLFDDVELMLYGIAVMVIACLLLVGHLRPPFLEGDVLGLWATAIFLMYAIGYPIGHTAVIGWFSKAMNNRPQGFLMGLFASAGSLARIVFPIATGLISQHYGTDAVFATLAVGLGAVLVLMAIFAKAFREAIA